MKRDASALAASALDAAILAHLAMGPCSLADVLAWPDTRVQAQRLARPRAGMPRSGWADWLIQSRLAVLRRQAAIEYDRASSRWRRVQPA